jgi:hypothetical protein
MAGRNLKSVLMRLGLRQCEFARLVDVSPRTVSIWASGTGQLPGPVAAYLGLLQLSGPDVVSRELQRLEGRNRMLDEGLYGLKYSSATDRGDVPEAGDGLAVLRNGKILGSDRWGGVFAGTYEFDSLMQLNKVHVRLDVPPDADLVTGFQSGPEGATIDVVAAFDRATPQSAAVVDVAGKSVEIELTYIGPLPG